MGCGRRYLKDDQEMVHLALLRALGKAEAKRLQQRADQPDTEEIVYRVDGAITPGHRQAFGCSS